MEKEPTTFDVICVLIRLFLSIVALVFSIWFLVQVGQNQRELNKLKSEIENAR